jgi:putative transposase
VRPAYPKVRRLAKPDADQFQRHLEALCSEGARELLQAYLDAEVDELLERVRYERRNGTQPAGYRDGYERPRTVWSNRGPIALRRPRVRGVEHQSAVLPKYRRRLENVDDTLNEAWIRGLSQRDCEPTLRALLGSDAPLSSSTIARVNARLHEEYLAWKRRRLDDVEFVYVWADGIHLGSGPDDERRVFLVVIGADRRGDKHLLALEEALSESEQSWIELFDDLKGRGMNTPALLVADGAHGLWAAAGKGIAGTQQQRCWKHKIQNVLDKLPEKHRAGAHAELREIMYAQKEADARGRLELLAKRFERNYPKAATCLRDDVDRMFAYYKFPCENHKNLRTTNPVESIFSSVRLRTDAARRLRTIKTATSMLHAVIQRLSKRWRKIDGHQKLGTIGLPSRLAKRKAA